MLEQLLALLNGGAIYHIGELARKLNTTPALVKIMLADLERMGLIPAGACVNASGEAAQCSSPQKPGGCGGCSLCA